MSLLGVSRLIAGCIGFGVAGLSLPQASAALVGALGQHPVVLRLPPSDGLSFEVMTLELSRAAHVAVGLERVVDPPLPGGIISDTRGQRSIAVTGMRLADALSLLLSAPQSAYGPARPQGYSVEWPSAKGVVHLSSLNAKTSFLMRRVASFELHGQPFSESLSAIHRALDPAFPTSVGSAGSVTGEAWRTPITVALTDATVRDVLDALALAHGDLSWYVRCRSDEGEYAGSTIGFASFDGSGVQVNARVH